MFGHCTSMVCPRGYNKNVSHEREMLLLSEYQQKGGTVNAGRMLHEFAYPIEEVLEMAKKELTNQPSEAKT